MCFKSWGLPPNKLIIKTLKDPEFEWIFQGKKPKISAPGYARSYYICSVLKK
jgi:hypothetical protein